MSKNSQNDKEIERGDKYGLKTMEWHGWGSPVGLGLFIVAIAFSVWLISLA